MAERAFDRPAAAVFAKNGDTYLWGKKYLSPASRRSASVQAAIRSGGGPSCAGSPASSQPIHFGDHSGVGDGVSELRIDVGPGYRVYYTVRGERVVLLLCGGDKDSQERDIMRAKEMAVQVE
ncbi:MAG TPA: type II toxin-antitoxin system RelE/ParE family toxin [Allosphingosinicella sp.]|jgi:hypothetical protein